MIELQILGFPRLMNPDGDSVGSVLSQPKRLALLSYLVVAASDGFVRRDRLLNLFWLESDEKHARASLSEALSRLRRSLGAQVVQTRGSDEVGINTDVVRSDVAQFKAALSEGRLEAAIALYRGPLLDGFVLDTGPDFDTWLEGTRASLARSALNALSALADKALEEGDENALVWAERARTLAPLDGDALRRLMTVMVAAGHRAEAIRAFDRFSSRLERELDMSPSSELADFAGRIRRGDVIEFPNVPERSRDGERLVAAETTDDSVSSGSATDVGRPVATGVAAPGGEGPSTPTTSAAPVATSAPAGGVRMPASPWIAGILGVTGGVAMAGLLLPLTGPEDAARVMTFQAALSPAADLRLGARWDRPRPSRSAIAISPDGDAVVYAARGLDEGAESHLYRRVLETGHVLQLEGTEGAGNPFFSPNGRWVGFFARRSLKRVSLESGEVETLLVDALIPEGPLANRDDYHPRGASWGERGIIVYGGLGGIYLVPEGGGEAKRLVGKQAPGAIERSSEARLISEPAPLLHQPHLLPGDHVVLFHVLPSSRSEETEIHALELEGGARRVVLKDAAHPYYLRSGHLFFARRGMLMAAPFDPVGLELTGEPIVVLEDVMQSFNTDNTNFQTGAAQFALSSGGHLAYVPGGLTPTTLSEIVRITKDGDLEPLGGVKPGAFRMLRVSPGGTRLAVHEGEALRGEIVIMDLDSGRRWGLAAGAREPVWSPDERFIAFRHRDRGVAMVAPVDGSEAPHALLDDTTRARPLAWSASGVLALLVGHDIWIKPPSAPAEPFIVSEHDERDAEFSPDARWLAFVSTVSGRPEVHVRPYPGPGPTHVVSIGGGVNPAWSPGGDYLYYLQLSSEPVRHIMEVAIQGEDTLRLGRPTPLLPWPAPGRVPSRAYDVLPDGSFIVAVPTPPEPDMWAGGGPTDYRIVLNFGTEVAARSGR